MYVAPGSAANKPIPEGGGGMGHLHIPYWLIMNSPDP